MSVSAHASGIGCGCLQEPVGGEATACSGNVTMSVHAGGIGKSCLQQPAGGDEALVSMHVSVKVPVHKGCRYVNHLQCIGLLALVISS